MPNYAITNPFPVVLNQIGGGLNAGKLYIGLPNQDPQDYPKAVYWDAAGTDPVDQVNGIDVIGGYITRAGTPASVFVSGSYSIRVRDRFGVLVYYLANARGFEGDLASTSGGDLVGFSNAISYDPATVGASLKSRGVVVTDPPFNADPTGSADSYAAFTAAIAASKYIQVPAGTYKLATEPTWTGSIYWDIDPEAVFTGAGTGVDKFPYMLSNPAQMAVGPYIRSSTTQKSAHANGGVAAFNIEMEQPGDYGAGQSVALYAGNISGNPNVAGNNWAINCLTYAQATAGGTYQSIEADANNDSPTALVKGIAITGAGAYDAETGLEIVRLTQKWKIGAYIANAGDGLVIRPVTGGRGVVVGAVGSDPAAVGDTAISARQMLNSGDTLLLQRLTDTAPTGQFIRAVNAGNSANLFVLDVSGNMTLAGKVTMNTAVLTGPAPVVTAGQLGLGASTAATANAGAATLPANPVGFLVLNLGGTNVKLPYYAA